MMDCTDQTNSAIQGQGYYFDRLFLLDSNRDSNCLARSYYPTRFPETVPFQWEKRPGLPKKLPGTDDVAIPLSPPPALHGLGLVLPRPDYDRSTSHRWTARFWRRISGAAGKSCSSSSSAGRRVASCSVPSSSTGVVAAALEDGSSSGLRCYSSFSSNSSSSSPANYFISAANRLIHPVQCCDEKDVRRCSSAGESSRMYYCGTGGEGVPFDWEMQPGKSKDPGDADEIEIIPPPTPPPAVQSRGLPVPMPESSKKVRLDSSSDASCFKYRTGSERRLEEQPPFCCGLRPWKIDDEKGGMLSHLLSLLFLFRNRKLGKSKYKHTPKLFQ